MIKGRNLVLCAFFSSLFLWAGWAQDAPPATESSQSVEIGGLKVRPRVRSGKGEGWFPPDVDNDVPQVTPGTACPLNDVLLKAGKRIQELVENVDKFTASEVVEHQSVDKSGRLGGPQRRQFNYLVSIEQLPGGLLNVTEYRNGRTDRDQFPDHVAIEYGPVQFRNGKVEVWLPSTCKFYMDFQGHRFYRLHRFKDFELFSVDFSQTLENPKE